MRFLKLTLSAEEEFRTRKDTLLHVSRSVSPCPVQIADVAAREVVLRNRIGQHLAVLALRAGEGHQVLHRRLGRDAPGADVFLDWLRQHLDKGEPLGHPAGAPIKPFCQVLVAQRQIPELLEQPPLFDRGLRVRCAQSSIQKQRLRLAHVPYRGVDGVAAQSPQQARPLMAVNQLIPARRFKQRHHHDRRLLTVRGERREKPPLPLRPPKAQVLVPHVDLVKLQIHREIRAGRATWAPNPRRGSLVRHSREQAYT